jgi:hypothetical protein
MPTPPKPVHVDTSLVFLAPDSLHQTEKPYKLQYDPGPALPRWNCENQTHSGIRIHDLRGREQDSSLSKQGFQILRLDSALAPDEFFDEEKVRKVYYAELKELLRRTFGASRVEILEHGVRKRHAQFPVSTGGDYEFLQPTSVVHIGM